jgi:hypothetical protein
MRPDKRGLSTVVTTLIIILLVLVAIGIIWIVIRGVIESGAGQIDVAAKCPLLDLAITKNTTAFTTTGFGVEIYRASGGDEEGVYFKIAATNGSVTCLWTEPTNEIAPLETRAVSGTYEDGCDVLAPTEISITPFMYDTENIPKLCPNSKTFTIV